MADKKKTETAKIVLERMYTIPLRCEWLKVQKYKRAKKAATAVREFMVKHMKSSDVKIGRFLNMELWKHGIRNPPSRVMVKATKDDAGVVMVELQTVPTEKVPSALRKSAAKASKKKTEKKADDKAPEKVKEAHDEKAAQAKKVEKAEIKELKTEKPQVHHPAKEAAAPQKFDQHQPAPAHQ